MLACGVSACVCLDHQPTLVQVLCLVTLRSSTLPTNRPSKRTDGSTLTGVNELLDNSHFQLTPHGKQREAENNTLKQDTKNK